MKNALALLILHGAVLGGLAWLVQTEQSSPTQAEPFPVAFQKTTAHPSSHSTLVHGASAPANPMEPQERPPGTGLLARAEVNPEQSAEAEYLAALRSHVDSSIEYPLSLQRRHIQGKAELKLSVRPDGTLEAVEITAGSGSAELDRLALASVRDAAPFAPLPESLKKKGKLELSLPLEFRIR